MAAAAKCSEPPTTSVVSRRARAFPATRAAVTETKRASVKPVAPSNKAPIAKPPAKTTDNKMAPNSNLKKPAPAKTRPVMTKATNKKLAAVNPITPSTAPLRKPPPSPARTNPVTGRTQAKPIPVIRVYSDKNQVIPKQVTKKTDPVKRTNNVPVKKAADKEKPVASKQIIKSEIKRTGNAVNGTAPRLKTPVNTNNNLKNKNEPTSNSRNKPTVKAGNGRVTQERSKTTNCSSSRTKTTNPVKEKTITDQSVKRDSMCDATGAVVSLPDQGYASEREKSPDEDDDSLESVVKENDILDDFFKFVSKDDVFRVVVQKTAQGLGLSVTGGVDFKQEGVAKDQSMSESPKESSGWPGLIRIKKIFPHGAAWQTGKFKVGDVLLAANNVALTGLSNTEALEVLRCSPRDTELLACRVAAEVAERMGIAVHVSDSSLLSLSSSQCASNNNSWLTPISFTALGQFDVTLTKVNGSLGFTLRKEDESVLGHYIRSLVKEPAISDGRIRPGDKIISVNNVDMSSMSHAEAVAFLRRCPETVTIRLFRDSAITPMSPLSPTEPEVTINRPRPLLRQEAQDLLHDLAVRKQSGSRGASPAPAASCSPCSPRRRRLTKTPSPDLVAIVKDRFGSPSASREGSVLSNSHNADLSLMSPVPEVEAERESSALVDQDLTDSKSVDSSCNSFHTPAAALPSRTTRPVFLDLGNSSSFKKQRFMFTPPGEQAPSPFACSSPIIPAVREPGDGTPSPTLAEDELDDEDFVSLESWENTNTSPQKLLIDSVYSTSLEKVPADGKEGLMKWKGVVLTPEADEYMEDARLGLVQTIELNKGWNSRLGFSVGVSKDGRLSITTIYEDSVAHRDGRLQEGDLVLRVNGENVENCGKDYVIDILRKTRGPVSITVRKIA